MLATEDASLAEISRRLRNGTNGAEHSPPAIAVLIDALRRERVALQAEARELEQLALLRKTGANERNAYSEGYRAALLAVIALFPGDIDLELSIKDLKPSFQAASEAAVARAA